MLITVKQRKWTFSSKYDISCVKGNFYAEKKLFSLFEKLKLYDENGDVVARIQKYLSLISKYDFYIGKDIYQFRTEKIWKGVFSCNGNKEEYKLLRHKGKNYSLFEGEEQIAGFNKNTFTVGKGDTYSIEANDEVNIYLLLCIVLIVDNSENNTKNNPSTLTIDFGNIGPEEQPFNYAWKPDKKK